MSSFTTKIFGAISMSADGTYWSGETKVSGRPLVRSIFISDRLANEPSLLDRAATLVDELDGLDVSARAAIATAIEDREADTVRAYIDFHLEELSPDVLQGVFGKQKETIPPATFLTKLELVGVAVHPASPDGFSIVLDYSLGREVTDQLLAVRIDMSGNVVALSHES